jgi:tetratricopeptide (TPR) repeat protein
MAIEGPLRELGIHDVFQLLDLSRKTGKLTVTSRLRQNGGSVFFERGSVVYAEIESNPHLLGRLLVQSGKINEADLNRARDMQLEGDERRLGEILVDIGALTEKDLERQMRSQIEEVVFELVGWQEGYFSFVEGELAGLGAEAKVRISTESLLMEGARRIDEWSRIERKIPHLGVVPRFAARNPEQPEGYLDLLPFEWQVLAAVDHERDIRAVAVSLGRSEFEVAKAVFGLESAGLLELEEQPGTAAVGGGAEEVRDALRRAEAAMDAGDLAQSRRCAELARTGAPHDPLVHLILGKLDLSEHRAEAAEQHLRRALRIDPMLVAAHRLLGNTLALQGRYSEAIEWWQRWMTLGERTEKDAADVEQVEEALKAVERLDTILGGARG